MRWQTVSVTPAYDKNNALKYYVNDDYYYLF